MSSRWICTVESVGSGEERRRPDVDMILDLYRINCRIHITGGATGWPGSHGRRERLRKREDLVFILTFWSHGRRAVGWPGSPSSPSRSRFIDSFLILYFSLF
ncbi:hypothetical protein L1987_45247 [Smallanthus sonchifolius]|uniref:Uncharacterized protein n=1 Tax=Smallanthus sonchifolius TaxID=185202 RepID=A0ACB9GSG4_9ASTR|nr:hypothetical protein L1987_45247 [Smallanthus sonchifolius]